MSYVNDNRKPIPTIWSFKFNNNQDFEHFFGLISVFSKLGKVVNELPPEVATQRVATPTKVAKNGKCIGESNYYKTPTKTLPKNPLPKHKFYDSDSSSDGSANFTSPESLAEKKLTTIFLPTKKLIWEVQSLLKAKTS